MFSIEKNEGSWRIDIEDSLNGNNIVNFDNVARLSDYKDVNSGRWIVLIAAIWSSADRFAIKNLLSFSQEMTESMKIGIKIFTNDSDIAMFLSDMKVSNKTCPVYLFLDNGNNLKIVERFPMNVKQLKKTVEELLW